MRACVRMELYGAAVSEEERIKTRGAGRINEKRKENKEREKKKDETEL